MSVRAQPIVRQKEYLWNAIFAINWVSWWSHGNGRSRYLEGIAGAFKGSEPFGGRGGLGGFVGQRARAADKTRPLYSISRHS